MRTGFVSPHPFHQPVTRVNPKATAISFANLAQRILDPNQGIDQAGSPAGFVSMRLVGAHQGEFYG